MRPFRHGRDRCVQLPHEPRVDSWIFVAIQPSLSQGAGPRRIEPTGKPLSLGRRVREGETRD